MKQTRIDGLDLPAVAASGARSANAPAFNVDVARSLRLHPVLALAVGGLTFFLIVAYALTLRPVYKAESLTYVEPLASKILDDGSPGVYDEARYQSFLQQQMETATRPDILVQAIQNLPPGTFLHPGEDIHAGAARLASALKVERVGQSYQISISLLGTDPADTAAIVNAATSAYLEQARKDENVQSDGRLQLLADERDRIQKELQADRDEQTSLSLVLGVAEPGSGSGNPYDLQIAGIRTELIAAREAHDVAAAQLESVTGAAPQQANGLDTVADDAIASDAGLASLKASLSQRRAVINSQMAGMTPSNPVYKQDQQEIAQLDHTLDARMAQLRQAAAQRVQDKLKLDLDRTGDVETKLNAQLAQQTAAAHSASPKLQRAQELTTDIARLQQRFATVDNAMRSLQLETNAPGTAHLAVPASVPTSPEPSRRKLLLALAIPLAFLFAAAAAVIAKKRDPRIYTDADVEELIGFLPIGVMPARDEVSGAAVEEYLLRMAAALERAYRVGSARSFVFTAASPSVQVTGFVVAMQRKLGELGFKACAVPAAKALATDTPPLAPDISSTDSGIVPVATVRQESFATAKIERLKRRFDFVLIDAHPLLHSAEAEYAVRSSDATILIVESGVTTAPELLQAGLLLQRLNVTGVGAVLQDLHLKVGNSEFRSSISVLDKKTRHEGRSHSQVEAPVIDQRAEELGRRFVFLEADLDRELEEELNFHEPEAPIAPPAPPAPVPAAAQPIPAQPIPAQPIPAQPIAVQPPAPPAIIPPPVAPAPVFHAPAIVPPPPVQPAPVQAIAPPPPAPLVDPAPSRPIPPADSVKRDFRLWDEVPLPQASAPPPATAPAAPPAPPAATLQPAWRSQSSRWSQPVHDWVQAQRDAERNQSSGHSPLLADADPAEPNTPAFAAAARAFGQWEPEPRQTFEPVLDRSLLDRPSLLGHAPFPGAAFNGAAPLEQVVPSPSLNAWTPTAEPAPAYESVVDHHHAAPAAPFLLALQPVAPPLPQPPPLPIAVLPATPPPQPIPAPAPTVRVEASGRRIVFLEAPAPEPVAPIHEVFSESAAVQLAAAPPSMDRTSIYRAVEAHSPEPAAPASSDRAVFRESPQPQPTHTPEPAPAFLFAEPEPEPEPEPQPEPTPQLGTAHQLFAPEPVPAMPAPISAPEPQLQAQSLSTEPEPMPRFFSSEPEPSAQQATSSSQVSSGEPQQPLRSFDNDSINALRESLRGESRSSARPEPTRGRFSRSFFRFRKPAPEPNTAENSSTLGIERITEGLRSAERTTSRPSSGSMTFSQTPGILRAPDALTVSQVEDAPSIFLESGKIAAARVAAPIVVAPTPALNTDSSPRTPVAVQPEPENKGLWGAENVPAWVVSTESERIRRVVARFPEEVVDEPAAPAPAAAPSTFESATHRLESTMSMGRAVEAMSTAPLFHAAEPPTPPPAIAAQPAPISAPAAEAIPASVAPQAAAPFQQPAAWPAEQVLPAAQPAPLPAWSQPLAAWSRIPPPPQPSAPVAAAPAAEPLPATPAAEAWHEEPAAESSALPAFFSKPIPPAESDEDLSVAAHTYLAQLLKPRAKAEPVFTAPDPIAAPEPIATLEPIATPQPIAAFEPIAPQPREDAFATFRTPPVEAIPLRAAEPAPSAHSNGNGHSSTNGNGHANGNGHSHAVASALKPVAEPQPVASWQPLPMPTLETSAVAPTWSHEWTPTPAPQPTPVAAQVQAPLAAVPLFRAPSSSRQPAAFTRPSRPYWTESETPAPLRKPVAPALAGADLTAASPSRPSRRWHMLSRFDPGVPSSELGVDGAAELASAIRDPRDRAAG